MLLLFQSALSFGQIYSLASGAGGAKLIVFVERSLLINDRRITESFKILQWEYFVKACGNVK